jgi:hypothetical protein
MRAPRRRHNKTTPRSHVMMEQGAGRLPRPRKRKQTMSKQTALIMMNKQNNRLLHYLYLLDSHYEALRCFLAFTVSRSDAAKTCYLLSRSRSGPRIKTMINLKPAPDMKRRGCASAQPSCHQNAN